MFSVLIPSYNHHQFLIAAVLSALRSDLVTELLIVDDGSTDRSPELMPLLCTFDQRVKLLDGDSINQGAHARLNQLVEAARTEWVSVLNSDDLFAPGRFEVIKEAASTTAAELIFGDLILITGEGHRRGLRRSIRHNEISWPPDWDVEELVYYGEWLQMLAAQNIVASTTNLVFKKDLWRKVGGFRGLRYCHDWDFVLRCAVLGKLYYCPRMLSLYRMHNSNTIKENQPAIIREVVNMFRQLLSEYPVLFSDPRFTAGLDLNPYFNRASTSSLVIVAPPSAALDVLKEKIYNELPIGPIFVSQADEVPLGVKYVYRPQSDVHLLTSHEVRNLLLAIELREYDAFLLSRSPQPYPAVGARTLADSLIFRTDAATSWTHGSVRVLRSYTAVSAATPVDAMVDLAQADVDFASMETPSAGPNSCKRACCDILFRSEKHLPVVFVLPAFLAIGGVERLVIDTVQKLKDKYRFVIITTEELRPEQGSLHVEACAVATVYDLAEAARKDDRLRALLLLKKWYEPALVWICNGSPWQIEHATAIREIFSEAAIVDNQAYDDKRGWICHYDQPSIRGADRFVAINQRIERAMIERYSLPADRIDLIYHGFNSERVHHPKQNSEEIKLRFGLKPQLAVFGMVGRLNPQKRPLDLVWLAQSSADMDWLQFVWVGSGELEQEFNALIKSLQLTNVTHLPALRDVSPVFKMLDGLIITSEFEGLPIVMLEALSLGIPVLSSNVGDVGSILDRYGSGMVFEPPGDILILKQAFRQFVRNLQILRDAALRSAPAVAEDFSSDRMARDYDMCFKRAIAQRGVLAQMPSPGIS